ncbi:hypothetical protein [Streptomyces fuscigenes]|uniref:hypothetical protein n=1 Tax=Streptomyces fuscigenes TaxID=1528880 RepID=UPI001F2C897E|nr:hypothetical protein [Streptomyces fuscigenes]MCF3964897.1 hypothetical protein [Streptomyces fuscigenes]
MPLTLWLAIALIPNVVLTCVLLRWLPERSERWIPALSPLVLAVLVLIVRLATGSAWSGALAAGAGFLWGTVVGLLPFRGWVSSWTLPVRGEARLRWREVLLVLLGAATPLNTRRTKAAMEKAFTPREVPRARGPFPYALGAALFLVPVLCAVAAGTAAAAWTR